jgi:fructose-bisphosphate aldolase, class II
MIQRTPEMSWRDNNKHLRILKDAEEKGYGVIAAIAYNLEQILGFVKAAEQAQSPFIIQFFPWAITVSDGLIVRAAADAVSRAKVPISIHLDHCQSPELVKLAADMGTFDSIMVDMSHYEKEENISRTRELVAYCNERNIATEAEPGRIDGGEDGVADLGELQSVFTTADEIEDFVATGVDALAPCFGNAHGEYGPQGPNLDFGR